MALPTRRSYAGAADSCTLFSAISAGDTSATLTGTVTNWPTTGVSPAGPFYMVIDPGLNAEEKVLVTARASGSINTMSRAQDGTLAAAHAVGAVCYPVGAAVDFDEANSALSTMTTKGDLLVTTGSVYARLPVGTDTYSLLADSGAANGVAWGQIAAGGIATGAVTSAKILDDTIVNADINSAAAIVDTKLATISTASKVSNSATTATSANTASAIVARDASGNFTAGTVTAALTGTASGNLVSGGALGTPSSGTLTNCTFPTLNQNTTGNAATATNVAYSGLTGTVTTWNQNTTGSAASLSILKSGTAVIVSDGAGNQTIAHGLGSTPQTAIVMNGDTGAYASAVSIRATTDGTNIYIHIPNALTTFRVNWLVIA